MAKSTESLPAMGLLLLLLVSCYDAPRTNPFDPALTPAVELLTVTVDSTSGSANLEWTPYAGKQPFAEYRVMRQVKRLVDVDTLAHLIDVRQTSYRDTTPEPEVEYAYWVEVVNQGGFDVESGKQEGVVYALPSIELLEANFSSDTATAELVWTPYRGPGFEAYEVWRKAPGLDEEMVKELTDVSDTTYTDSLLDGNTEYTYHIVVRTGWEGLRASSNEGSGRIYPFDRSFPLPEILDTEPRAVALAVDEQDQLYIAMTMRETRGILSRLMKKGVQVYFPSIESRTLFSETRPDLESPIHVVAGQGRVYVSVRSGTGKALITALSASGEEIWSDSVDTEGNAPVGLFLEADGKVLMADDIGFLYRFGPEDHQQERGGLSFQFALADLQSLPVRQVVVGPGVGRDGGDHFFFLTSNLKDHHVLVVSRRPKTEWSFVESSVTPIDDGIGPEKGKILNPTALTFDPHRQRLLVLEAHGRLQVFDGRYDATYRHITQWGKSGTGDGEFLIPQPTSAAIAVDSRGMIYVADGSGRIQVFAP